MEFETGLATLTPEQSRFAALLSNYPKLMPFWNFEQRECNLDYIESELQGMRTDLREKIMLKFLVMVWMGIDLLNFSLIDAMNVLDQEDMEIILSWTNNPFYP